MHQAMQAPAQTRNRWRFAPAANETVTGSAGQDLSTPATHALVEMFAADSTGSGPVQIRFVPPGWQAPSVPLWVTRTEFTRLCTAGSAAAALRPEHDTVGAYAPIGGVAFVGQARPRDVKQGLLGSCRCASAFQAVAAAPRGPGYLAKIITSIPNSTAFQVRLRASDAPSTSAKSNAPFVTLLVDNCLPVNLSDGTALYQLHGRTMADPPNGFALWPALLEKAIATMWGSYALVQDSALAKVTEDMILQALGIGPLGITSKFNLMSGKTVDQFRAFVEGAWAKGAAITAAAAWQRHNFAVVAVEAGGVVMADPNTGFAPDDVARWNTPNKIGNTPTNLLTGGDVWPIFVTWDRAAELFQWVYTYDVAKADTA